MPNMKAIINSHSHKLTNPKTITEEKNNNCVDKAKCPLSHDCHINKIIYKEVLTSINPRYKEKSTSAQMKLHLSCDTETSKII